MATSPREAKKTKPVTEYKAIAVKMEFIPCPARFVTQALI
jgi:hypothetical protein